MTRAPRATSRTRDATGPSRQAVYRQRKRAELAEYRRVVCPTETCTKMHHQTGLDDCPDSYYQSTHPDCPHGQTEGYDLYGCRCPDCRGATSSSERWKINRTIHQAAQRAESITAALHAENRADLATSDQVAAILELWVRFRGENRRFQISRYLHGLVTGTEADKAAELDTEAVRVAAAVIDHMAPHSQAREK